MKKLPILLLMFVLLSTIHAEDNNSALGFSAMKTKSISVNINIESTIYFSNYTNKDEIIYKIPVFYDSTNQQANFEAYYYDNNGNKIFANTKQENGNSYATFNIKPIERSEYVFFISGNVISENKTNITNNTGNLADISEKLKDYTKETKFIKSDTSEIRTLANFLKSSDDPLENLVNVTNWVHGYLEYDLEYVSVVNNALTVLAEKKGVCDEFSILEAAILRAQGYPVRYVVGYANTGQEWGAHAWLEVYVPGQDWIPVDPTYNEVGLVDATHISLEKLKDPVESKESVTSTEKVTVVFGEKKQRIVRTEAKMFSEQGYENVINMSLDFAKDALQGSPHIVKLKLKNNYSNPITILVTSQLATDFLQIYPKTKKTVYYLKPFEEKTIDYYFKLPDLNNSYIYEFGFSSQFGDKMEKVNIHHNKGIYQELFFSYDPVIYFKDNQLIFENKAFNYTKIDKTINYNFDYNGTNYSDSQNIPKYSTVTYTRTFTQLEDTSFNYSISGDFSASKNIAILPTIENLPVFDENHEKELTEEEIEKSKIFDKVDNMKKADKQETNYVMVAIAVLFILFILYLLISKSTKRIPRF